MAIRIGLQAAVIVVLLMMVNSISLASGVEWGGGYRFEYNHIENPAMDGSDSLKEYMTHHMILRPKIVAADGLNIYGRFDIFNNSNRDQIGAPLGAGSIANDDGLSTAPATTQNSDATMINVTQLYLTLNNEYGAFIVGRTPFHFGLGMTHNAGEGLFDHFYDTRDSVGYKVVYGNYYAMVSLAKIKVGSIGTSTSDVSEYNLHLQFDNPENDMEMGLLYSQRRSAIGGNTDFPAVTNPANFTQGGIDSNLLNIYVKREFPKHKIAFEAAINDGSIGKVDMKGYGLALEYEFKPENKRWAYGVLAGMALGDDTKTTDAFESYRFDPNYNVGLLLFNQPLGTNDAIQNNIYRSETDTSKLADVDSVSNASYLAPYATYQWKKDWSVKTSLITGQIFETINSGDADLGIEIDASLIYKPHESFQWVNEFGYLMPGKAFDGSGNSMALVSKIAISF